jgi:hypothetical protein
MGNRPLACVRVHSYPTLYLYAPSIAALPATPPLDTRHTDRLLDYQTPLAPVVNKVLIETNNNGIGFFEYSLALEALYL